MVGVSIVEISLQWSGSTVCVNTVPVSVGMPHIINGKRKVYMYQLVPQPGHMIVVPLKSAEVKEYTGKTLSDVETSTMDVLQYGRVVRAGKSIYEVGDIVLYPKLASDKTNFGEPRQVIVQAEHVKAYLKEINLD